MCAAFAAAYPVSYTNCGLQHSVDKVPERIVTMTQGATEFMLSLGLASKMVGTAYLDDAIWPEYKTEYDAIPVLSASYPDETTIMSVSPDFIVASFNSAFRQTYNDSGKIKGIFASLTPCAGTGGEELGMNEQASNKNTCRGELNAKGIGTFLFQDACENKALRPTMVSEDVVYSEMRAISSIFKVDPEPLIVGMKKDFADASQLVSNSMQGGLKTVWLDCVGRCCKVEAGQDPEVYVGAGNGVPAMLMQEAGLTNVFASTTGNWACVKEKDVIAAAPDVIVVVDAAWDLAVDKLKWLYNQTDFCNTDALKAARLVQIPFSATSLSPRNGGAAHDLANAALHVRMNSVMNSKKSGVGFFDPQYIVDNTKGLNCGVNMPSVVYGGEAGTTTAGASTSVTSGACSHYSVFVWLSLAAVYMR